MNIEHIDDILPHIAGRAEFIVAERPGYQVIDYNFALADSFDDPARQECRGIKFDARGNILARPFHKFHNVGETPATQPDRLDFTLPHVITEKLDGSMIHPAIVDGALLLMTRMGHTDVAMKAEKLLTDDTEAAMVDILSAGFTPIFEFTAPNNRIIIRYEQPQLSLLAARNTITGEYVSSLDDMAQDLGLPLVRHYPSNWKSASAFVDYFRAVQGIEGFVVRFDNGLWVKAKGDDYVLKHKAKDSILQEKNILAMIIGGQLDDVLPLLEDADKANAELYRDNVRSGISATAEAVASIVQSGAGLDQKTFAVDHLKDVPAHLKSLAFTVRQGKGADEAVAAMILKNVGSQTAVDTVRALHGAVWDMS